MLYRSATSGTWTELSQATSIVGDQIIFDNITITSDGYYTLGTKNFFASPLPIKLSSFEVMVNANSIDIVWTTTLEKDVKHFELQCADNTGEFTPFEIIAATGGENKKQNYSVVDTRALNGTRYYRLKTIDNNNSFELSPVRAASEQWQGFQIFPKPAKDIIEIKGIQVSELKLQLVDAEGKFYANESSLSLVSATSAQLNVSTLPSGTYLLRIHYRGQVRVEKIPIK